MNTEGSVGQISTRDVTVENVLAAFMNKPEMATQELYQQLALDLELEPTYVSKKVPVGWECFRGPVCRLALQDDRTHREKLAKGRTCSTQLKQRHF